MGPHHRRFLVIEQGIGSALFNILLNGLIGWAMFRRHEVVPLWGQESIAGDTLGTCFFLPFITALVVTALVRRRVRKGGIEPLHWTRESHPILAWLPEGTFRRAVVLGFGTLALVGPPVMAALYGLQIAELTFWQFIAFKALFSGVLALVVTPLISIWALAE